MEGFVLNSTAGNSAPVGGKRRSHKKLRVVKKKTVRKMLKKMGLKMRGGATGEVTAEKVVDDKAAPGVVVPPVAGGSQHGMGAYGMGGRRRRSAKKTARRGRKGTLFGMKY